MKTVLTHGYFLAEDVKEQHIMKPYPPLGILYISAWLKKHGQTCEVFDSTFSTKDLLLQYLTLEKPGIVAIYTNLMTKVNVLSIIAFIRNSETLKETFIVLGGPEVTYSAENFLAYGANCIVVGEGEQTMLEIVRAVEKGEPNKLGEIPGIVFREATGEIVQTPEREKLKDLDLLPMPDRQAIRIENYLEVWKARHGKNAVSVSTMRGCPYTCKWCSRAVYGLSYRRRSPGMVVEELGWIQKHYAPDSIWFVDDVFTVSHKWLQGFVEAMKASELRISYECISRADRLNDSVLDMLKQTGCFRIWIGAESGSQRVIDAMDRRVDVGQTRDMIKLARSKGMEAGTFIMLGYPGETEADIEETIHHLMVSQPDHYTITLAYPIKGTELYQEVESDITDLPEWASSSDREINFRRTYSPGYYRFALMRVRHAVAYGQLKQQPLRQPWKLLTHKAKAGIAKILMRLERLRNIPHIASQKKTLP